MLTSIVNQLFLCFRSIHPLLFKMLWQFGISDLFFLLFHSFSNWLVWRGRKMHPHRQMTKKLVICHTFCATLKFPFVAINASIVKDILENNNNTCITIKMLHTSHSKHTCKEFSFFDQQKNTLLLIRILYSWFITSSRRILPNAASKAKSRRAYYFLKTHANNQNS